MKYHEDAPRGFRPEHLFARPSGPPPIVASFSCGDDWASPEWEIHGRVAELDGKLAIVELNIGLHPGAPGNPSTVIDARLMSTVKPAQLLRAVRRSLAEHARLVAIDDARGEMLTPGYAGHASRVAEIAAKVGAVPEPGRKGHDDALYRLLAFRYLELQGELGGSARGIVTRLMKEPWDIDKKRELTTLPRDTVKSRLRKCGSIGFLTFNGGGRAGAEPGPRLFEDLQTDDQEEKS